MWIAIGSANGEITSPVVEQDQLWIRLIIAQNHIQVAAFGHIRQRPRIALGGFTRKRRPRREVSPAITKKDPAGHLPMASLDQHDVRMSITVEVANAGVGGGFRNCL